MTTQVQLPTSEEMTERLKTWVERYRVAGATVAWMRGDEVQTAAAGFVNAKTRVETTPDSVFQIGSITKVYTTTLIMQLVDEGRIDLDAPAVKYLPDLRFADAAETPKVTIRHLLTHSSGVDGDYFEDFGRGDDAVAKYVAACKNLPFIFPLGEMWSYCNAGFVVLGRIIETMTRHDVGAGAPRSHPRADRRRPHRHAARGSAAVPHRRRPLRPRARRAGAVAGVGHAPRAGARRLDAVLDGRGPAEVRAPAPRRRQDAATASRSCPKPPSARCSASRCTCRRSPARAPRTGASAGCSSTGAGRRVIGHDGGTVGQNSSLRLLPDEDFAVAILTNTSPTGGVMAARIMRWLFGLYDIEIPRRPEPPETAPDIDLAPYVGTYEKVEMRAEVTLVDGRLWLEFTGTGPLASIGPAQPPMPLFPVDGELMLQMAAPNYYSPMTFSHFENGKPKYFFSGRVYRRVD